MIRSTTVHKLPSYFGCHVTDKLLVLNAAVRLVYGLSLTADGFEANFGINYLVNFLLVLLLLDSMDKQLGRIVCISTIMHDLYYWMNRRAYPSSGDMEMYKDTGTVAKGGKCGKCGEYDFLQIAYGVLVITQR
jgi:hypothetical protein